MRPGLCSGQVLSVDRLHGIGPVHGGLVSVRPSTEEVVMRRILFPALGVVVLLLAYAGQELAAGVPSAPRDSAQTGPPVRLLADEANAVEG